MDQVFVDLKKAIQEIAGHKLVKMVLYGSRARGDYRDESDTDIAIIVRGLTPEMKRMMYDKIADVELDHLRYLSTLILSEDDFELLKKRERRIASDIEREGIPL